MSERNFTCQFVLKHTKLHGAKVCNVNFDYMQLTENKVRLYLFDDPDSPVEEFYFSEIEFIL